MVALIINIALVLILAVWAVLFWIVSNTNAKIERKKNDTLTNLWIEINLHRKELAASRMFRERMANDKARDRLINDIMKIPTDEGDEKC